MNRTVSAHVTVRLRVRPIVFGLTFVVTGHGPPPFLSPAKMPGVSGESSSIVKSRSVWTASLSWRAWTMNSSGSLWWANPGKRSTRVESVARQIAAELICEVVKERLRFIMARSTYLPNDLVLARRGIEDKVRCWNFG